MSERPGSSLIKPISSFVSVVLRGGSSLDLQSRAKPDAISSDEGALSELKTGTISDEGGSHTAGSPGDGGGDSKTGYSDSDCDGSELAAAN